MSEQLQIFSVTNFFFGTAKKLVSSISNIFGLCTYYLDLDSFKFVTSCLFIKSRKMHLTNPYMVNW